MNKRADAQRGFTVGPGVEKAESKQAGKASVKGGKKSHTPKGKKNNWPEHRSRWIISDFGERGCAMHAGSRQVLLLFKEGGSRTIQSPYDGNGNVLHLAFAIPAAESRVGKLGTPWKVCWRPSL